METDFLQALGEGIFRCHDSVWQGLAGLREGLRRVSGACRQDIELGAQAQTSNAKTF